MMPRLPKLTFSIVLAAAAALAPVPARALFHGSGGVEKPRKVHRSNQKAIQQMEEDWNKALLTHDAVALGPMIGTDFMGIAANGNVSDKEQYLDHIANSYYAFRKIEVQESKIRILKTVAIVTTLASVDATLNGHVHQGMYRYTRVYHLESGTWKVVNFEATHVSGSGPGDMSRGRPLPKKEN